MTNQEVSEFMQRFLDDDLNEDELEALMEHIRQTPASAAMFERLQRLDNELESLPKVIPPVSIVDSILPRLELAGLVDHPPLTGTTASDDIPDLTAHIRGRTTKRDKVNYRWLGGVVAAGIVVTLFISNFGSPISFETADEDVASSNAKVTRVTIANNNASLERETADIQTKSSNDSSPEPAQASTFSTPAAPNSEPSASAASSIEAPTAAASEEPWVDQGRMTGAGATDRRKSSSEPTQMGIASNNDAPIADSMENKISETASEERGDMQTMLTMNRPSAAILSPDEKLSGLVTVVAEGGQHIVITDQSGQLVYESAVYEGTITELTWSPDSAQLHFEVAKDNEDIVHMTIDLSTLTENIKAHE